MPQPRQPRPGFAPVVRPYARKQATGARTGEQTRSRASKDPVRGSVQQRAAAPAARAQAERKPRAAAAPAHRAPLSPAQKRYLRGFAHALKPVILVGHKGITPAVLKELDGALEHHELVKVKLADGDRESRAASIEQIRTSSGAELVQAIGHVACFYRLNPDLAAFTLPK